MKLTGMTSTGARNEIMRALEKETRSLRAKRNDIVIISKIILPEKIINLLRK